MSNGVEAVPAIRVSRQFVADFEQLKAAEGWSERDAEEIRAHIRAHPAEMVRYWTARAAASKAGYRFEEKSSFERLDEFCKRTGIAGPYGN